MKFWPAQILLAALLAALQRLIMNNIQAPVVTTPKGRVTLYYWLSLSLLYLVSGNNVLQPSLMRRTADHSV